MIDTRNAYKRRAIKRSGSSNTRLRKWPLAAAMEFLDKYNIPPSTTTNMLSDEEEDGEEDVIDETSLDNSVIDAGSAPSGGTSPSKKLYKPNAANPKRKKTDAVEDALVQMLKKESEDDEDKGFFMSLYKDFRGIPDDQKLEAKMALMQAMYTVKHGRGRIPPETQVPPAATTSARGEVPQDMTFVTISPTKFQQLFAPQGGQ